MGRTTVSASTTRLLLLTTLMAIMAPAALAVAATDPLKEIEAIASSTLSAYDEIIDDFATYLVTANDPDAVKTAYDDANTAVSETRAQGRESLLAIEVAYRGDADVKTAVRNARNQIDDGANAARSELRDLHDRWRSGEITAPPPTTTTTTTRPPVTTTTTTTTTASPTPSTSSTTTTTTRPTTTSTTVPTAQTTPTTTPPPRGTTTTTTTQPEGPVLGSGDAQPPAPGELASTHEGGATSLVPRGRWDPVGFIAAEPTIVAPSLGQGTQSSGGAGATIVAWVLDPSRSTTAMVAAGPLVLFEAMARALAGAGRGLAAPTSLLLSLTVALVVDRRRLSLALRGLSPDPD